jgi:hypothetical protein
MKRVKILHRLYYTATHCKHSQQQNTHAYKKRKCNDIAPAINKEKIRQQRSKPQTSRTDDAKKMETPTNECMQAEETNDEQGREARYSTIIPHFHATDSGTAQPRTQRLH